MEISIQLRGWYSVQLLIRHPLQMMKCPLIYQSNARDGQINTELSPLLLGNLVIQLYQMDQSIPINVTLTIESSDVVCFIVDPMH